MLILCAIFDTDHIHQSTMLFSSLVFILWASALKVLLRITVVIVHSIESTLHILLMLVSWQIIQIICIESTLPSILVVFGWQIIQENDWEAASTVVHLVGDAQVANLEA